MQTNQKKAEYCCRVQIKSYKSSLPTFTENNLRTTPKTPEGPFLSNGDRKIFHQESDSFILAMETYEDCKQKLEESKNLIRDRASTFGINNPEYNLYDYTSTDNYSTFLFLEEPEIQYAKTGHIYSGEADMYFYPRNLRLRMNVNKTWDITFLSFNNKELKTLQTSFSISEIDQLIKDFELGFEKDYSGKVLSPTGKWELVCNGISAEDLYILKNYHFKQVILRNETTGEIQSSSSDLSNLFKK